MSFLHLTVNKCNVTNYICYHTPVCSPALTVLTALLLPRLGFTYLRLKDNHMEILNREDEVERWVNSEVVFSTRFVKCMHTLYAV